MNPQQLSAIDSQVRQTSGAHLSLPLLEATRAFEDYIGRSLNFWHAESRPVFGGEPMPFPAHRSLTAVALATNLEHAGLSWEAIDPGVQELRYWRTCLEGLARKKPRTVALSTTFIMSAPWLHTLCSMIRRALPETKILVGGYYYATNARKFLTLDADVLCVGEGEERLPQIVQAICDGAPLDAIPGLYLSRPGGGVKFTGSVEPLRMASLPRIDWSLAPRIQPPIDLEKDAIEFGVETQRGCSFKCEFCTYRTLASPSMMEVPDAVEAILGTAASPRGYINMADSTATFPHTRWEELMRQLVQRGGSPHPMWAFARVSDITAEGAGLMAQAGVRQVFVGQESGDQRMLNLMKKGTRVDQVKPAIAHLARNQIGATFGFFHGFPGENAESLAATRGMIASLNDDWKAQPVVLVYLLYPFIYMDFASVSSNPAFQGVDHYLGYASSQRTVEEVLQTFIATSRIPHAPAFAFLFEAAPATSGIAVFSSPHRLDIFHWLKAVERGVAIFLEEYLEGRKPDAAELRRIRDHVMSRYAVTSHWRTAATRASARVERALARRLKREWAGESASGVGSVTRALLSLSAFRDTGAFSDALRAWKTGTYDDASVSGSSTGSKAADAEIDVLANSLITLAVSRNKTMRPLSQPRQAQ